MISFCNPSRMPGTIFRRGQIGLRIIADCRRIEPNGGVDGDARPEQERHDQSDDDDKDTRHDFAPHDCLPRNRATDE